MPTDTDEDTLPAVPGLSASELRTRLVVLEHYTEMVVMVAMSLSGAAKSELSIIATRLRTDERYRIEERLWAAEAAERALVLLRDRQYAAAAAEISQLSTALWKPIADGLQVHAGAKSPSEAEQ